MQIEEILKLDFSAHIVKCLLTQHHAIFVLDKSIEIHSLTDSDITTVDFDISLADATIVFSEQMALVVLDEGRCIWFESLSNITAEEFMGMKKIQNFQDNTLCSIFFSQSFKTLFVSKKNNEIFRFDLAKNSLASISETTLIVVEVIQPFKVSSKTNPKAYSWAPANLLMN